MMCLRRRSIALPSFRTGGASCLGRTTRRSRCGTWRRRMRGDAGRALASCVAASAVLFVIWLRVGRGVAVFPDGRRVVSGSTTRRSRSGTWRRRMRGDAERALEERALRRRCALVMCFVVGLLRCRVSGRAAGRVWVGRCHAQGVGHRDRRMRGDAERALVCVVAASTVL